MQTLPTPTLIKLLKEKNILFFTVADFQRLTNIKTPDTAYKRLNHLEKRGVIKKVKRGLYQFLLLEGDDFLLANTLYSPSYVSLESALSFWGIITGFAYQITSVTPKLTRTFLVEEKEFCYFHLKPEFFWGWQKQASFLVAEREKAIIDYLYFGSKGLRSLDVSEFDLSEVDLKKLYSYALKLGKPRVIRLVKERFL